MPRIRLLRDDRGNWVYGHSDQSMAIRRTRRQARETKRQARETRRRKKKMWRCCCVDGVMWFEIKWTGYRATDNTRHERQPLQHCTPFMEKFLASIHGIQVFSFS